VKIQRLYCDSDGESHFGEVEIDLSPIEFAPPAPPIDLSPFWEVKRVAIMRARPGWAGDWHAAPRRQLMFYLAGQAEGETSDGARRTMDPGTVVLVEDTTGKGHRSWVVGDDEVVIAVAQLE
jgi:hypothetical protein